MPRTRHSRTKVAAGAHVNENKDAQSTSRNLQSGQKRTFKSSQDSSTSNPSTPQSTSNQCIPKKARMAGPHHGRPLQLELPKGSEEGQEEILAMASKRAPALKRTSSFYPNRHLDIVVPQFPTHAHSEIEGLSDHEGDTDIESEIEEEWLEVPQSLERAMRLKSKTVDTLSIERPVWKGVTSTDSAAAGSGTVTLADAPFSQESSVDQDSSDVFPRVATNDLGPPMWPSETDLIFTVGSNNVKLTVQQPVMRAVIQDAIERIRASLIIKNAFPKVQQVHDFITEGLCKAAENNEMATDIHSRLVCDCEYMKSMSRLPRARIPLIRWEVKDRCSAIVRAEFLAIGSTEIVKQLVEKQRSNYNYTYPTARKNDLHNFIPMRTRPYRNERIITIIHELFFSGGSTSFAARFCSKFPVHRGNDGVVHHEVPVAMVALVATALYAAIGEWVTGVHKMVDFSTRAYNDAYDGHVNTFGHILANRGEAFHLMMSDIFVKANNMMTLPSHAQIADIDLDVIEA